MHRLLRRDKMKIQRKRRYGTSEFVLLNDFDGTVFTMQTLTDSS